MEALSRSAAPWQRVATIWLPVVLALGMAAVLGYLLAPAVGVAPRNAAVVALSFAIVMTTGFLLSRVLRPSGGPESMALLTRLAIGVGLGLLGGTVYGLLTPGVGVPAAALFGAAAMLANALLNGLRSAIGSVVDRGAKA